MWNVANVTPEEAAGRTRCCAGGATRSDGTRTRSSGPSASDRSSSGTTPRTRRPGSQTFYEANPGRTATIVSGSADEIAETRRAYVARGFRHIIYHLAPPYDDETLERFAKEVRPQLAS